jgi:hypothetical protein
MNEIGDIKLELEKSRAVIRKLMNDKETLKLEISALQNEISHFKKSKQ